MGNTFIINAPMTFSAIWAVVKGFLDEKTRAKFKIIGSNFMPTIEQYMDRKDIPAFMGGEYECETGISHRGPWDDYEIHGNGIRRKQAAADQPEEVKGA